MRQGFVSDSLFRQCNLTFGAGANETPLQEDTEGFAVSMQRLFASRYPRGSARDPLLFRLQPEAWLESTLGGDLAQIDDRLGGHAIYHQVPAFAAANRAMLDLFTVRNGRLALLELKADRKRICVSAPGIPTRIGVHWLQQQRNSSGKGELERTRLFSRCPAAAERTALVLHRARTTCASIHGHVCNACRPRFPGRW